MIIVDSKAAGGNGHTFDNNRKKNLSFSHLSCAVVYSQLSNTNID